jgi:hypothetical protein
MATPYSKDSKRLQLFNAPIHGAQLRTVWDICEFLFFQPFFEIISSKRVWVGVFLWKDLRHAQNVKKWSRYADTVSVRKAYHKNE